VGCGGRLSKSLLALLLAYGALATLPIVMVGSYLFFTVLQGERDHLGERVRQVAAAVAGDVDRELQRRETVLGTLATSPLIASGDLAGFHAQARAAVANQNLVVLLQDAISKQQLVNTFVGYGTSLPTTGDPDTFDRVLSNKRVEVSDLFMSLVSKGPAIDIALPIIEGGNVRYLLKLALTPDHFWQIIAEHSLELRWRVTIVDRRGIIIARTDAQDRFVGQALPGPELKEMRSREKMLTSEGIDGAMTAWATVPSAGWTVRVSAPFDVTQSSFYRSIGLTSVVTLALVLTLLLGLFFAARLSAPLSSVARMAQGLVRQEPVVAPPVSTRRRTCSSPHSRKRQRSLSSSEGEKGLWCRRVVIGLRIYLRWCNRSCARPFAKERARRAPAYFNALRLLPARKPR
jgi:hypothetical protein